LSYDANGFETFDPLRYDGEDAVLNECVCEVCDRRFVYSRQKRTTRKTCRNCMVNRDRFARKAKMIEYKGGGCQVCGYSRCQTALDFHHVDPETKEINFNHGIGAEKLVAELDKCVCLCSNCHREVHAAIEAVAWGHPPAPIIEVVHESHRNWTPTLTHRDFWDLDWRERHPKYYNAATGESTTAAARVEYIGWYDKCRQRRIAARRADVQHADDFVI
jgi:hypothetical protein